MCDTTRTRSYLRELSAGSRAAQNDFTLEFFDCAFRHSWKTLEHDERVESVDDAFLKIFACAFGGKLYDLTGSYVHEAVGLQCRNRWNRRERRPRELALSNPDANPAKDDAAADLGWEDMLALGWLTKEQIQIIELRFVHGCTYEEIAQQTGVSRNTVRERLRCATEKLRRFLEQNSRES